MAGTVKARSLFDATIVRQAIVDSFRKLTPRRQVRNPVMFVVYVGSILTTLLWAQAVVGDGEAPGWFILWVSVWLWFTVLFANFAEAMAGESAPVIRESGGDRSSVTGGTQVLSDWLIVEVTADPGEAFLDRMISLVEGAKRQKTPNEIALDILLAAMTIIFLLATATL